MVEFKIRNGASWCADRLPIHPHDVADERLGAGECLQDVVALIVDFVTVDLDEADIIGTGVEDELTQPIGVERMIAFFGDARVLLANPLHGGMFGKFMTFAFKLYMQVVRQKRESMRTAVRIQPAHGLH